MKSIPRKGFPLEMSQVKASDEKEATSFPRKGGRRGERRAAPTGTLVPPNKKGGG